MSSGVRRVLSIFFPVFSAANLAVRAVVQAAGNYLTGSLVDIPPSSDFQNNDKSSVFNIASGQNQARLQEAIPVLYGRFRIFPDLISQPWTEYLNNEQYIYQLMCITLGHADLEKLFIGDTDIQSFKEITYQLLQPTQTVTLFHCNVVTNDEIRQIEIEGGNTTTQTPPSRLYFDGTHIDAESPVFSGFVSGQSIRVSGSRANDGLYTIVSAAPGSLVLNRTLITESPDYTTSLGGEPIDRETRSVVILQHDSVGPFNANLPGTQINRIGIDIEFSRGLYNTASDGSLLPLSVSIQIEYAAVGSNNWIAIVETFTAAQISAQRYTRYYEIDLSGRVQVRMRRLSATQNTTRSQDQCLWTGLKGFINNSPNDANAVFNDRTVLAVKMRASGQLSGGGSRLLNGIFQRRLKIYQNGGWSAPTVTSAVAWAFADLVMADYAGNRPPAELDLEQLQALDTLWQSRGDGFNGYFNRSQTLWEALQTVARCGRATPIYNGRNFSMMRDEPRPFAEVMFSDRNTVEDSFKMDFNLITPETPTGVSVEYYDPISFQKKSILAGSDVNARTVALTGCTSRAQAWREANFILRDTLYRRLNLQFSTEMEGFIPQFGSLIVVQNNTADWGQAGSVLAFSPQSVRLDTEFNWSSATQFSIRFCQPNGQPSAAISCSRGDADDIANLTVPSFVTQGTQYVLSTQQSQPINALVRRVSPTDNYHCGIEAVLDDPRVHQDPGAPPPETL